MPISRDKRWRCIPRCCKARERCVISDAAPVLREIAESNPQIMGGTQELPFLRPGFLSLLDESSEAMFEESGVLLPLLTAGEPNAGG
jgi:hypothetical protein